MAGESDVLPRGPHVSRPAIRVGAATLQLRFLAWLIDVVLISFVADLVAREFVIGPLNDWVQGFVSRSPTDALTDVAISYWVEGGTMLAATLGCALIIVVPSFRLLRATPGQRLMGLMTTPGAGAGRLGIGVAVIRVLLLFLPWAAVASFRVTFGLDSGAFADSTSLDLLRIAPWLIRAGATAWYMVLVLSIASGEQGVGLHDRLTDAAVLRRFGAH